MLRLLRISVACVGSRTKYFPVAAPSLLLIWYCSTSAQPIDVTIKVGSFVWVIGVWDDVVG